MNYLLKPVYRSVLLTLLALSACAPATDEARTPPTVYAAAYDEVFSAVVELVAQDAGVPAYNPGGVNGYWRAPSGQWLVTSSDREAGLIAAEARSRAASFIGSSAASDVHYVNILVEALSETPPRVQVSVQGTERSRILQNRLRRGLSERFGGLE